MGGAMSLSLQHEAPLEIFDQHPRVVASLLSLLVEEALPDFDELRMEPADFTQTAAREYRADRALVFLRRARPVLAVILEVQRRRDEKKRRAWPVYTAALYGRLGCPTYLLVIALDEATARWARQPIAGFQPGSRFAPLVVAPSDVPAIRSVETAHANVPLALFSALLHVGDEGGEQVAYCALRALYEASPEDERLDRTIWMLGLVGGIVGRERFQLIERLVMIEPSTKIIPRLQILRDRAIAKGLAKGLAKGIEKGMKQGLQEGMQQGLQEGMQQGIRQGLQQGLLEGEARALLKLLAVRGLEVSEARRRQVLACTDRAQLERWIERAATAGSVTAVFGSTRRRAPSRSRA
jgi:hypothetical protein